MQNEHRVTSAMASRRNKFVALHLDESIEPIASPLIPSSAIRQHQCCGVSGTTPHGVAHVAPHIVAQNMSQLVPQAAQRRLAHSRRTRVASHALVRSTDPPSSAKE